jgi:DNA-binding response OmpR family regulator
MTAVSTDLCRVLIVEDDPDSREVLTLLIGHRTDCQVRAAESVGEALGELRDYLPTHILLDLNLPDYSGAVLLREVRRENLPVRVAIVTAAGPTSQAVNEAMQWRPDAIFYKPVRFGDVEAWLQQA